MKIYKFRGLTNELNYCRLREIIETGNFWCSNFWELNDPMEGVFSIKVFDEVKEKISEIYGEKGQYKICSFSGEKGFENPIMWGYYADGFKGVAIEVEVEDYEVKKVNYCEDNFLLNETKNIQPQVERILLDKNQSWIHEDEYRFLDKLSGNSKFIGKITAVYFGAPYEYLENTEQIQKDRKLFMQYKNFKEKIIKIAKREKIEYFDIKICNGKVKKII